MPGAKGTLLVKRNSAEFREIKEIVSDYADVAGRKRWILLYSLKPYHTLKDAVLINEAADAAVLYELAYDSLHDYIYNRSEKLYRDGESGIYYFKKDPHSKWIEQPFAFAGKLKKQLKPLQQQAHPVLKRIS